MALNKWKYGIPKKEEPKQTKKLDKAEVFNKTFAPSLPFVPTVPTQERLSFNQPKLIESDLPKTTKVTAPITGSTFGLDNVKTYQAPIGQSKKELDIKDKAEKKEAKETAETLQKELTEKYGFKVKRANSPIEYANILLKVPANQKEQFKKDYDAYIIAAERSNPFRAGAEAGFNILPTNLEKTQGKEVVEEAKGYGLGRFVGGAGQQAAFASVLSSPIEGLVGKVLPKATPLVTETIKDVAIGTGTQIAEAPFDKPTAGQFVGNAALDVALNVLFGAVGKGLSKVDLSNLRSAKPKSVVDGVARELGVSEAEADKVLDDAIDFYVNQYGTASPTQFEQLQLPAPEVKPEFKSDTFASTLRNKTNDIYVNQFGVADTKPFEQLQLEAPKNIASDTFGMRLSEKVKAVQPKVEGKIDTPKVLYHGTSTDFEEFSDALRGTYSGAESAKSGFYFTDNPKVADTYRSGTYDHKPLYNFLNSLDEKTKLDVLKKSGRYDLIDAYEMGELEDVLKQMAGDFDTREGIDVLKEFVEEIEPLVGNYKNSKLWEQSKNVIENKRGNVIKATLDIKNPYVAETKNGYFEEDFYIDAIKKAKENGNDGVIFKNVEDVVQAWDDKTTGELSDVYLVFDKNKIKKIQNEGVPVLNAEKVKETTKPQLDRPSEFSIGKPQYPPLAKPFAKDVISPVKPKLNAPVKEVARDFTIQKPIYPKMQPEFTKERPSVLQPGDRPNLKVLSEETTDPVLKKFRLDLFGATPEKPVKAIIGGNTVDVVKVKGDTATLSDGTTAQVKNISAPKTKIEPILKSKQVDFEKETLSGKTETVASGEIKERGFSENIRTDKNRVDELRQEFDQDKEFYETLSNKSTLESAQARFDRGYDLALKDFRATSDTIRADNVPLAKLIADEAVRRGDMETAREVIVKAAESLTKAGQFSQAAKILRESNDPITVMKFVNSEIKKLNTQGSKRYGKGWEPIKLDENELNLIAKITKDTSDEQKEEVFQQIFDSLVKRIPTTKREKFDAWRRIAMLFNPKTHVRNTLGNGLMRGLKTIADKTAQTMELTLPKDVRTKGFATKELKEVSKNYFEANKKKLLEGSRWDIFGVASPFSEKRIFKTQFLESLNEISKKTLEGEDIFFFKSNFINDLAGFMNARGLKEPTEEAVEYALRRSQEATFRQANAVANAINGLKGSRLGLLVDAAIPFTKTPANILQTSIDYSPIGAMKSVVQILNKADPTTAIENLSKGLTGTGLALIGAWASYNGLARGAYEKSNKVEGLYQATGMLPNSIKTPGGSYTIDWAQPIAMPFFMGVAFMDELKKNGQDKADAAFNALLQSGETLVQQSMLSGVKDLFGGYGTMTEKIIQLPINYMTQGFPTVGGQIARVIDPLKRQIDYSNIIDSTTTSLQAKTPLLSKELPVKRDILGKPQEYGKGLLNAFQQFLSPGFIGKESDDPVINEIDRLYKSVGADFLPKARVTNFTDEKVKYNLTTKEISEVQRIMGEYTNKQLLSLMNSYDYKNASDTERAKMIKKANETGYELAKKTIVEARKK